MKAQLNLFNESLSDTLDKTALKERIQRTHFLAANPSFTMNKWVPEDDRLPMFYKIEKTPVGELLIAATAKGVTYLGFIIENGATPLANLKRRFPANIIAEGNNEWLTIALDRINNPEKELHLHLHLKGTEFQLSVWEKLILIPFGGLANYKQ
jgi:AraC family transcriptional regulator of adaptative response/methylated-DNA-[protein]-cysteine methyltransferase